MGKVQEKRDALRGKLIELAQMRIRRDGLAELRARDLAQEAGCALGSLYNMFEDMDALVLAVNAQTLEAIDVVMVEAVAKVTETAAKLQALGQAYLAFAREEPLLWRALFEHHLPIGRDIPDWYAELLTRLMSRIAEPLALLQPDFTAEVLAIRSRTLFAAVHGVISISLDNRFVGLAPDSLESELQRFIQLMLEGAKASTAR